MWIKPPIFFLVGAGFVTLLFLNRLYRILFYTEEEYNDMIKKHNKSPNWYPLKKFSDDVLYDEEKWAKLSKTTTILGTISLLGFDILLLIAFLLGK